MASMHETAGQQELDGYCVIPDILTRSLLECVRYVIRKWLDFQPSAHFARQKSTGSMISVMVHPLPLGTGGLGRQPPSHRSFSGPRDGDGRDDPLSCTEPTLPIFLMYGLVDTIPANGCLQVLRGSHRRSHAMHNLVPKAHTEVLQRTSGSATSRLSASAKGKDVAGPGVWPWAMHGCCMACMPTDSDQGCLVVTLWFHPLDRCTGSERT